MLPANRPELQALPEDGATPSFEAPESELQEIYILDAFVKPDIEFFGTPPENVEMWLSGVKGRVNADGNLNLRAGPGQQHEMLRSLPDGTSLLVFGEDKENDEWLFVDCGGVQGYVHTGYVDLR